MNPDMTTEYRLREAFGTAPKLASKPRAVWGVQREAFGPTQITLNGRPQVASCDAFFEFPSGRVDEIVGTVLAEYRQGPWWTPLTCLSVPTQSGNEADMVVDGGVQRIVHEGLVSNTFALHPEFGCGHVLRTNGHIAAFWDGVEIFVVGVANLIPLRVRLDSDREAVRAARQASATAAAASKRGRTVALALAALLDL